MSTTEAGKTPKASSPNQILTEVWPWLALSVMAAGIGYSWMTEGIVFQLLGSKLSADERVRSLQSYFQSYGRLSPLLYVGFVITEVVVVPIPGLILYAPGGLIFGPLLGGVLATIGNTLGAGIACALGQRAARGVAKSRLGAMFENESVQKLADHLKHRGGWVLFLLRVNPLTSSDVLSYAAGFSGLSIPQTMLATALGIAPLAFAQAWLSDSLLTRIPQLIYPLAIGSIVYLVVVVVILKRILKRKPAE